MSNDPKFSAGRNIAMKVPPHVYEETIHFYREVLRLKEITSQAPSVGFEFGAISLWIDRVAALSQSEIWLEVLTDDVAAAARHFEAAGVTRRDEIETLPEGMHAFWISSPASVIHLVAKDTESWT